MDINLMIRAIGSIENIMWILNMTEEEFSNYVGVMDRVRQSYQRKLSEKKLDNVPDPE